MGDLSLNRNKNYKQGIYIPKNKDKFYGEKAYYRSGLELDYFRLLDNNENIIKWGSENIVVDYLFNEKWHKYYIDLFLILKSNDKIKKYFVEIKPFRQTLEPKMSKRKKERTFINESLEWNKNNAKWFYASLFAKKNGFEFKILTEKDLSNNK